MQMKGRGLVGACPNGAPTECKGWGLMQRGRGLLEGRGQQVRGVLEAVMEMKGRGFVGAWPHRGCGQIGRGLQETGVLGAVMQMKGRGLLGA